MRTRKTAGLGWMFMYGAGLLFWAIPSVLYGQTPAREYIVDILTTPNKYWNKQVIIKGHVRSVTANPPGTNRGSFLMRDSSDADIFVITQDLPAMGKEYTVMGVVEQQKLEDKVPILHELRRALGADASLVAPPRRQPSIEIPPVPVIKKEPPAVSAPPPPPSQPAPLPSREPTPAAAPAPPAPVAAEIPWLMIVAIGALVVLLVVVLFVMMRPHAAPVAAPVASAPPRTAPVAGTQPAPVKPVTPPPSRVQQAADNAARGVPTQAVSQPAKSMSQPTGEATEVYMNLRAELTVTDGPDRGKRFNLTKPVITIGRGGGRQNDITLSDATVSREHARIVYSPSDRTFQLVNESAVNPVLLNGNAVEKSVINNNDTLSMGATVLQFKRT